ncbi:MAG: DUF2127 domain-containing protein [Nanoarchaeota archaeon]
MRKLKKESKNPPTGVKLIALFLLIMSFVFIILGIGLIKVGLTINQQQELLSTFTRLILAGETNPNQLDSIGYSSIPALMDYAGPALIGAGVALIIFGLIRIFIGFHLWNGRTWTKVVIISFSIVWFTFGVYGVTRGVVLPNLVTIFINLLVLYYVLFNKHAQQYFSHLD